MVSKSIEKKVIGKDIIKSRIKKWMRYESGLHFGLGYAIIQQYKRTLYPKAMLIAFIRVTTYWSYACAFTKDHTWTSNNIEGESGLTSTLVIYLSNKRTIFYSCAFLIISYWWSPFAPFKNPINYSIPTRLQYLADCTFIWADSQIQSTFRYVNCDLSDKFRLTLSTDPSSCSCSA